jgi:hypothetical protein
MFDAETTKLIEGALPLEGIDLADLPQRLTEDYAKVVSIRMQAANPETDQQNDDWISLLHGLRDLAEPYEAITVFLPEEDPHRASCAFVAGSAYHILTQASGTITAERQWFGRTGRRPRAGSRLWIPRRACCTSPPMGSSSRKTPSVPSGL